MESFNLKTSFNNGALVDKVHQSEQMAQQNNAVVNGEANKKDVEKQRNKTKESQESEKSKVKDEGDSYNGSKKKKKKKDQQESSSQKNSAVENDHTHPRHINKGNITGHIIDYNV